MPQKIIKRKKYLNQIYRFKDKNIIKVITGQRRVGKSFIMQSIISDLRKNKVQEKNIIYINKEDLKFDSILTYKELHEYIEKEVKKNKNKQKIYLLIDEIQEIEGFEKTIRNYALDDRFDIYITGSNSKIISSELSTFLSGRYIEIYISALSYNEFLQFSKSKKNNKSLKKYIKYGGLPFIHSMELSDDLVYTYAKNIYNSILLKDVVKKFEIRNVQLLEKLVIFLCNNIGYEFSANSISKYLKSEGVKVAPSVLIDYIYALRSSYFIHEVKKYDLKGKRVFKQNSKYYVNDIGIKNAIIKFDESLINQVIENIVYTHLIGNEYEVYTGILGDKEIDFVAMKNKEVKYIQVALTIENKKTRDREFGNLLKIDDNFEKIVITLDDTLNDYLGVRHIKLVDFLTDEK